MNINFSVILLCLSSVYCISTKFDNLDLYGLKQILNGKIKVDEWNAAMDQQIYKDVNGTKTPVNVKAAVENFKQNADNSTVTELYSIRSTIKTAYQCMLARYASITTYLIFQELWEHKTNINWAINHMELNSSNFDIRTVFNNETFREIYCTLHCDNSILDFNIKLEIDVYKIFPAHQFFCKSKRELHNFWAGFIEKQLGLKINYKIYTDVIKTRFTNKYKMPFLDALNELVCVLNEAIQLFDSFIKDKCVPHDSSFEMNFESLKTGVSGDFMWLLTHFDTMKAREASKDGQHLNYNQEGTVPVPYLEARDSNWELYRDFSKPIPGKQPAYSEITASGCFVENLEFEISGFKTDFKNTNKPTDIYGHSRSGRTSEIKMKLVETTHYAQHGDGKIGLILIRDKDKPFSDYLEYSRHTPKTIM